MINVRADNIRERLKTFMYNGSQMLKIDIEYPNVKRYRTAVLFKAG